MVESHHVRRTWITLFFLSSALPGAQTLRVDSPPEGARPHSAYLTVAGAAAPLAAVEMWDNGAARAPLPADREGRFERVLRLAPGRHEIRLRSNGAEVSVHLEIGAYPAPKPPAPYEKLQTGDILLVHDPNSQQDAIYQLVYTHCALYIGPGSDGAPLLLEAVSEADATPRGPVAAVPIEESLAWREKADRADVFRLAAGLTSGDRARIVAWARQTANRGLPFLSSEFGDIYRAWLLWDPQQNRPRDATEFENLTAELRARLEERNAFDCATLIWRAYLDNTAAHIDLAQPNRFTWGGAKQKEIQGLMDALHTLLILPDSLALSGKLRRVEGE